MSATDSSTPILSIIVPSRNRAKYALSCIRSVLSYPSDRFELVVQDNSDNNELEDWVSANINDVRLKYSHTREPLNVIENFSRGLENATGTYITFYGDDDGAIPEIVDAALWADKCRIDVLTTTRPADYTWPDKQFRFFGSRLKSRLDVKRFSGTATYPHPETELRRCATAAGDLTSCNMPLVYRGIARRDCLEKLKSATGTYFPGPSPDLAAAIGLASHVTRVCRVDYPLFLPGASIGNVHSRGRTDYNELRLESKPHLPSTCVENWSQIVPAFFSATTIWGETTVQALKATHREDVLRHFNIGYLHAMCIVYQPALSRQVMANFYRALRSTQHSFLVAAVQFAIGYCYAWSVRVRSLARNMCLAWGLQPSTHSVRGLNNIEEAVEELQRHVKSRGPGFPDCLPSQDPAAATD